MAKSFAKFKNQKQNQKNGNVPNEASKVHTLNIIKQNPNPKINSHIHFFLLLTEYEDFSRNERAEKHVATARGGGGLFYDSHSF